MRHPVACIDNNPGGAPGTVESQDCLYLDIEGRYGKCLEHDLANLFSVSLWVLWSLGKEYGMVRRLCSQLIEVAMVPHLLHHVPVLYLSMLYRVGELQHPTLC
eukprot:XP_001704654.1 Hypothetical protein GL50803_96656 [Giardia lamblia ATCC 50803]